MIPKKMLDFRIKVAGVRKIWYSKYLWLNYLILTFAVLLSLFFVRISVFNNAKEINEFKNNKDIDNDNHLYILFLSLNH